MDGHTVVVRAKQQRIQACFCGHLKRHHLPGGRCQRQGCLCPGYKTRRYWPPWKRKGVGSHV